ncbi:MAG: LamG domain-containing protein [Sphingobacteriales bacterium]|nr:LamG domain-containing protein [Sphingobacteriales bacterium]
MRTVILILSLVIVITSCKKDKDTQQNTNTSTLNNGLIAYYLFNGNANDATSNQNHGTVNGASLTVDRFGNANQAYLFNGASSYIQMNSSVSLDLKESFSISAWIRPDNYLSPGIVIWHGDAAFAKDPFLLYFSNRPGYNSLGVRKDVVDGLTINECWAPPGTIFSGVWSHVVGVCDATTKKMKLYINGELMNTVTFANMSIAYSTNNFITMIGAALSTSGIGQYFQGKLDEIRIYNRELTQSEVKEIFQL